MIKLPTVHVNLTNICNQHCSFCFAKKEMINPQKRELSLEDLHLILKKARQGGVAIINLIGGEPTLHSHFEKVIELVLNNVFSVRIFTNGLMPPSALNVIQRWGKRIGLTVNIATPDFLTNKVIRNKIINNIKILLPTNPVALSIVSTYLPKETNSLVLNYFDTQTLKKTDLILMLELPVYGSPNPLKKKGFKFIGEGMAKVAKKLDARGYNKKITFSGLRPCMISPKIGAYLMKRGYQKIYKCHTDNDWFTITSSYGLEAYKCYPLATTNRLPINSTSDFREVKDKLKRFLSRCEHQYVLSACKTCKHFGFRRNQCSGPCVAYRMNELQLNKNTALVFNTK